MSPVYEYTNATRLPSNPEGTKPQHPKCRSERCNFSRSLGWRASVQHQWRLLKSAGSTVSTAIVECLRCYGRISNNRMKAVGRQHGAGGWQSEIGQLLDDFWDLGDPPISQISHCCLPVTGLALHDLQMSPGDHWSMSQKSTGCSKILTFP